MAASPVGDGGVSLSPPAHPGDPGGEMSCTSLQMRLLQG